MHTFVLFLALVAQGSGGVTTEEFDSRIACEDARAAAVIAFYAQKGGDNG